MRHWIIAAALANCVVAPAVAGTITDTIMFHGAADGGDTTVTGPEFNPALGTLTNVSVTLTGTLNPKIFTGAPASSAQSLLDASVNLLGGGGAQYLNSGSYTLQQNGAYLVGPAETFRFTDSVSTPTALSFYTAGPGSMTEGLANLLIYSNPTVAGSWGSMPDDVSGYSGQFAITYTYAAAVPEPGSLALLLASVVALGFAGFGMRGRRAA